MRFKAGQAPGILAFPPSLVLDPLGPGLAFDGRPQAAEPSSDLRLGHLPGDGASEIFLESALLLLALMAVPVQPHLVDEAGADLGRVAQQPERLRVGHVAVGPALLGAPVRRKAWVLDLDPQEEE